MTLPRHRKSAALSLALLGLVGCQNTPKVAKETAAATQPVAEVPVRWRAVSARRQISYLRLDLPVVTAGTRITVTYPENSNALTVSLFSTRLVRGAVEGPLVDQLLGEPRSSADAGSYLVPLAEKDGVFTVAEPMPVFAKIDVGAAAEAGERRVLVRLEVPGKAVEELAMVVEVSEVALPTEPRVLGVMTTTMGRLAAIYPESFGALGTNFIDRGNPEHAAAVGRLDELVKAAKAEGMALFVEDFGPGIKVDNRGMVTLDWDAYDRVVAPYMDGTAFLDRVPEAVWLAPAPPRRIRDSSTQLWQYIDGCAKHFADKGWVGAPAFIHPAMAEGVGENTKHETQNPKEEESLRVQVGEMMRLHMPREMLAVTTADGGVVHGQLWAVEDGDPRLPPAGGLGTEASVRVWPWMCVARGQGAVAGTGVRGFVWRDGVSAVGELKGDADARPLLVVAGGEGGGRVMPTLKMAWLGAGLNDAAMLGLLEKRSDATTLKEVLAGVVGRTGMTASGGSAAGGTAGGWPDAPPGFLYAGWLTERGMWGQVPGMLERLVSANDPGRQTPVAADDPVTLAAKVWLGKTRRPVARVAGFSFGLRPGRQGDIFDARVEMALENPVDAAAEYDVRFLSLPGDMDVAPASPGEGDGVGRRFVRVGASGAGRAVLPLAGHLESIEQSPGMQRLEVVERHGGGVVNVPVAMPIYRTHAVEAGAALKLDGDGAEWAVDKQLKVFGEMKVGTRYMARPDLVTASVREDAAPAAVRWAFDDQYLYFYAKCPQDAVTDERNTEWPVEGGRWWGGDGLQVQIANTKLETQNTKPDEARPAVVQVAFKPSGVVLVRTGRVVEGKMVWTDGGPGGTGGGGGVRYGIRVERREGKVTGYAVEAAVPRAWVSGKVEGVEAPAWRVNVLRHRAGDLASMSWSGPVVDDGDVGMMGLLVGE